MEGDAADRRRLLGRVLKAVGWVLYLVWVLLIVTFWITRGLDAVPWGQVGLLFLISFPLTRIGERLTRADDGPAM